MPLRARPRILKRSPERLSSGSGYSILDRQTQQQLKHDFEIPVDKPTEGLVFDRPILHTYDLMPLFEKRGFIGSSMQIHENVTLPFPNLFEQGEITVNSTYDTPGIFSASLTFKDFPIPIYYHTHRFSHDTVESMLHNIMELALLPLDLLDEIGAGCKVVIINTKKGGESPHFLKIHHDIESGLIEAFIVYPDEMVDMQGLVEERKKAVREADKVFFLVD